MMKIIIIMIKLEETMVFGLVPQIDFYFETKARKVMVDLKLVSLYR